MHKYTNIKALPDVWFKDTIPCRQIQIVNQVTYLHVNKNKGHVKIGQEF